MGSISTCLQQQHYTKSLLLPFKLQNTLERRAEIEKNYGVYRGVLEEVRLMETRKRKLGHKSKSVDLGNKGVGCYQRKIRALRREHKVVDAQLKMLEQVEIKRKELEEVKQRLEVLQAEQVAKEIKK